jgi:hypothetical protein
MTTAVKTTTATLVVSVLFGLFIYLTIASLEAFGLLF